MKKKITVNQEGSITMSRGKVSPEEKLVVAKACAEGRISQSEAARRIGVNRSNVREWTALYNEKGAAAFEKVDSKPIVPVFPYDGKQFSAQGISSTYSFGCAAIYPQCLYPGWIASSNILFIMMR